MSRIYDNWERLVAAVLRKQQLWELFHDQSRSPIPEVHLHILKVPLQSTKFSPPFELEDLLRASAKYLGKGTFGSAYAAALHYGTKIVIKRLKLVSVSEPQFRRHMEVVGNIRDENVTTLRAYFCSKDEKLLLYDCYSNGSVSSLLHGENGENRASVDWPTRMRIAVGAARGIAHIHTQIGGKLVHGNIKASNIFLNSQRYGCISDLGMAYVAATAFIPNSYCYAPEVENTQNVSQASDVYSFGVLLLELLTKKSPVQVSGSEAVDLVKLANSVNRKKWIAKIFDTDVQKNRTVERQMEKMLQIGMMCVAKSPKRRPRMSEVVKVIEDSMLIMVNQFSVRTKMNKLMFFEDARYTFDLEDLLRASAEVLGRGMFGVSYKVILENGITIVVKRSKEVVVAKKEFQRHMEVMSRMQGHENVSELRAHYYSVDEKLLVYDYHSQGSVSALLHGKRGSGRKPLDWKARLRIAIGAARGFAHIHKQDGGKFLHGNIRTSNIFLNEQRHGRVSDVGLATLSSPTTLLVMRTAGYCAPEVMDIKKISQASDVYSFGVVLLELISGKRPIHTTGDGKVISLVRWIETVIREEWTDEVFDAELLRYQHDNEAMLQLLQIAMGCVDSVPKRRPKMADVLMELEAISETETVSSPSVE
ncbi:probable inactive receptor kinase At5g58300 [Sesamum indicum]|uniref:Probable inactive receptor kinase At5g58300 n=1 Tax=Sesamum indicum TaxID=4182 RepID=A0A8M8UQF3_SESIN|nr:probable inactive receptor kinase At5g58300 [Sesamum indicum]